MSILGLITFIIFSVVMILRTTRDINQSHRYYGYVKKADIIILICKMMEIALAVWLAFWLKEEKGLKLFEFTYVYVYAWVTIISMFVLRRFGYETGFIYNLSAYWFEGLCMEAIFMLIWANIGLIVLRSVIY